jgi:hypothetical protein
MSTPPTPTPSIPPEKLAELIQAMHKARDGLLKASLLLRDHLYETDVTSREQARQAAETLIRQCKPD